MTKEKAPYWLKCNIYVGKTRQQCKHNLKILFQFMLFTLTWDFTTKIFKTQLSCWSLSVHIWAAAECCALIGWRERLSPVLWSAAMTAMNALILHISGARCPNNIWSTSFSVFFTDWRPAGCLYVHLQSQRQFCNFKASHRQQLPAPSSDK